MINNKCLNVLSISSYGSDLSESSNNVFSGAQLRQIDYSRFFDKYIIIVPSKRKFGDREVKLSNSLFVHSVYAKNKISFLIKAYIKSCKITKKEKINIISTDNPFDSGFVGVLLKFRFGITLLINSMAEMIDNHYYIRERFLNLFKNLLAKVVCFFADYVRVSTNAEIERMIKRGFDQKKLFKAGFYIDSDRFENSELDQNLRGSILQDKYDKIILYLGRVALQKDLKTLLFSVPNVIKFFPRTLFLIVGDGPEMENIKKIINKLEIGNNIVLLGKVKYGDVPKYYKIADVFCATSIYEGTCMTLLEAAASKLPIVATKFAGAVDLIEDGKNGYVVEIGDSLTLSKKLNDILSDSGKIKIMGENNYNVFKNTFNKEVVLKEHEDFYESIKND